MINQQNINKRVCKEAIFYWQDSHDAYLTMAKKQPHTERVTALKRAQACRRHYQHFKHLLDWANCQTVH